MSDARDEIGRAAALQRRRAAAFQRRKEEAEAEIEQLRAERAGLARLEATPEVAALSAALGEKIEALTVEAAAAASEVRAALGEVTQLGQLARSLPVAEARNLAAQALAIAGGGDLPGDTVVARALDGARDHIAGLEAEVRFREELAADAAPAPSRATAETPGGRMSEAEARAVLAAMRAGRQAPAAESAPGEQGGAPGGAAAEGEAPPRPVKRTL